MPDRIVFRAGARAYTRSQVLSAAGYRSALDDVQATVDAAFAAQARAAEEGIEISGEELDAEAERYRVDRDLTTAEDTERWLADHDLTVDDFTAWIERRLLQQRVSSDDGQEGEVEDGPAGEETESDGTDETDGTDESDESGETGETDASQPDESADTVTAGLSGPHETGADPVWAEVVFGGHLSRFVRELAWRVAAYLDAGPDAAASSWDDELATMERAFGTLRARVMTPANVARELAARRALLMVFEADLARFDSLDAAREAWLCTTEDGAPFEEVAASAGVDVEAVDRFLDEFPEAIQPRVLSASEGEILSPVAEGDAFLVCRIRAKRLPEGAGDETVRRRIEAALMGRTMDDLLRKHVTWE